MAVNKKMKPSKRMKMQKSDDNKAEIHLMENVFVVFILLIIGAIVLIVFSATSKQSAIQSIDADIQLEALKTARMLYNFPEIQCTVSEDVVQRCVDKLKIESFKKHAESNMQTYFPMLGYVNISIYCHLCDVKELIVYDSPPSSYNSKLSYHMPVLVNDPANNFQSFGYIRIMVYK